MQSCTIPSVDSRRYAHFVSLSNATTLGCSLLTVGSPLLSTQPSDPLSACGEFELSRFSVTQRWGFRGYLDAGMYPQNQFQMIEHRIISHGILYVLCSLAIISPHFILDQSLPHAHHINHSRYSEQPPTPSSPPKPAHLR